MMTRDKRLCIINVVGLTPTLLEHAPSCKSVGTAQPWQSVLPAVTSTVQASLLTGKWPAEHGIVANGWYFRDTAEIRFWQQNNGLIECEKFYEGYRTAKMFWWFNQNAPVEWSATPKPHYGCDGSKEFDILDRTGCNLVDRLGPFPFASFWGPAAGIKSSQWIAEASAITMKQNQPEITLVYLPHLDYDYQRFDTHDPKQVEAVDQCVGTLLAAAAEINATPVIVSEYGLRPVTQAVCLNRILRSHGHLAVRRGPFGEMLMPGECSAFAVCDHQLAHIYVRDKSNIESIQRLLESTPGVGSVHRPAELGLEHPRSGELVVLADEDAWFAYHYWEHDQDAPDFAKTVDIHRKPGYDPCELFMTSKRRAVWRLLQKKLGFRYKFDVIPLDNTLVRGSHGLIADESHGPLVIGPDPPSTMLDFFGYVRNLMK
jgi:predicted AlkP superfamily pyrophosphatase or phosphodiesterase